MLWTFQCSLPFLTKDSTVGGDEDFSALLYLRSSLIHGKLWQPISCYICMILIYIFTVYLLYMLSLYYNYCVLRSSVGLKKTIWDVCSSLCVASRITNDTWWSSAHSSLCYFLPCGTYSHHFVFLEISMNHGCLQVALSDDVMF